MLKQLLVRRAAPQQINPKKASSGLDTLTDTRHTCSCLS